MTVRAKVVLLVIVLFILLVLVLLLGRGGPDDTVLPTPTTTPEIIEEENENEVDVGTTEDYFTEEMWDTVIAEIGQPIEGFEPFMFMEVYEGLLPEDFEGVEAELGVYTVAQGEVAFEETEPQLHSAARAITREGMETLLENIAERLDMPTETEADIDALLLELEEPQAEE